MNSSLQESRIAEAMLSDQHRLRQLLRRIRERQGRNQPIERDQQQFEEQLHSSVELRARRQRQIPATRYDDSLPIAAKRAEIEQAIRTHQVIVVCGETGSGKSTQLPKICLNAGRGIGGMIGHTQPRRLAARTIASRLADELQTQVGEKVGFKIRFTDTVRSSSYVKLMTDGILLAESQQDRFFEQYDTIIIDEAHERSLNIDFLMGYIKQLLPKRPDLRLIITSATIDAERFAAHFGNDDRPTPVIEVSGRSYPVETRYVAVEEDDAEDGIVAAVEEMCREGAGDVLVFLPTEREIRDAAKRLRGWSQRQSESHDVLPLYARLSNAEQNRVFQTGGKRRIVLATNVAESSLTVPGIRYVVDTGTARISRYSPRSKVQRLPIEPVSRASADQRQGRCGRVAPGVCIRLYSEEDYQARDRYTTPEIRRTNLAAVILRMLSLRLGSVDEFPFLDPPRNDAIRDGYKTLFELGAIDNHRRLTEIGKQLSRLPVDPRIGRMILAANDEGCLAEVLIIAAALEVQDPRDRPVEKQQQADEAHKKFAHAESDFLTLLEIWDFIHRLKNDLSRSQLKKACQQNFLSFLRLREWQDVHRQLKQLVQQAGLKVGTRRDEYDPIHHALLTGLLSNVAMLTERHEYQAAGNAKAFLWPGSGLFEKKPKWVMAAEAVETTKRYLRSVARIDPAWVEKRADHLVKRTYSDPYWSRKQGTVLAKEKVSLFGLPISAGRRVKYGPIDAPKARELFLQSGLVEAQARLKAGFYRQNVELIERLKAVGARARQAGYLVPDGMLYSFYETRIPADVYDGATLQRWLNRATAAEKERLVMREEDLLPESSNAVPDLAAYPDRVSAGSLQLEVNYRFLPGDKQDGLSIDIPAAAAQQVDTGGLEWMVPGLLEEKLTALIRSLPKSIRRSLVPAPDSARTAAARLEFGSQDFLPAVAEVLSQIAGETIPVDAFDLGRLPSHLRPHFRVLDDQGAVVAEGREWEDVKQQLPLSDVAPEPAVEDSEWHRDGLTTWGFDALPAEVQVQRSGMTLIAYPTLVDQGDAVGLRLLPRAELAERTTRQGLVRLICLTERRELKSQVSWLPDLDRLQMFASTLAYRRSLREQLMDLLAHLAYVARRPLPRTREEFEALRTGGRRELLVVVQDVAKLMPSLWEAYHQLRLQLDAATAPSLQVAVEDLQEQLNTLLREGFLGETSWRWLQHFPRYLQAMSHRLDKLQSGGAAKDREGLATITPLWEQYTARREAQRQRGTIDPELETYRWLLEEFRVSLFAQQLGTAEKVSPTRLEKQWAKTTP